ncbi:MAG TPA: hypothetical protein PKD49_12215 [Hyphomicrobium sp.]|nr:hypothetical protein [Hyphomicrobium sp.]
MPTSLLGALLKAALGPALWVVVGLSLAAAGHATWRLSSLRKLNADIHALVSGRDLAVDPGSAPGELNLARTNELLRRDRLDEAQALAAVASPRLAPAGNAKLLYNLANYRLRQAVSTFRAETSMAQRRSSICPRVSTALALRLSPDDWDIKYNLDVVRQIALDPL